MNHRIPPLDLDDLKTYPLSERKSLVSTSDFAVPHETGASFVRFLSSLPGILAGKELREVIDALAKASKNDRTVIFAMGAHVIKVGLSPLIIDLMARDLITAAALNGAGIIHDFEIAFAGCTSEDVAAGIGEGRFGMAEETGACLSRAIALAETESIGLGEAVGRFILQEQMPYRHLSILAEACRLNKPVTVHLAFGTDILHMHPAFDPRAAGGATHMDFRRFARLVTTLSGGVFVNIGSAVILPEVFLKALSLANNLGYDICGLTTVNLDFIRQYRPLTNVVQRPVLKDGRGYNLIGHHEILLPLIAAGLIEQTGHSPGTD